MKKITVLRNSWLCLIAAAVFLLFANGANTISIASWLAPVFLLRFVRKQKPLIGLLCAFLVLTASIAFQFRGMIPIPPVFLILILMALGLAALLPYIVDRLLINKLRNWTAVLVFPVTWTAVEYLVSFEPFGTWGLTAYSQYGNLPLLQLLSVTGMWGITFLIGWFASVCNLIWEEGFASDKVRKMAVLYSVILVGTMLLGGIRLTCFPPASQTVRIAGLTSEPMPPAMESIFDNMLPFSQVSDDELEQFRTWTIANNETQFMRARREAEAGAKIVMCAEGNWVLKEDEADVIDRGKEIAAENNIYLALGMISIRFDSNKEFSYENKIVMITPEGEAAWEYFKARPIPGSDAAFSVRGDGKLKTVDTPYGVLSGMICFDGDFPRLSAQAGKLNADIVLNPANDWQDITPWHSRMASFRSIEQGFNQIRTTDNGMSEAYDYQGQQLSSMNYFLTENRTITAHVPVKGVRTLYTILGDWFAWLCLLALPVLILQSLRSKRT